MEQMAHGCFKPLFTNISVGICHGGQLFLDKEPQYLELYDNITSNATVKTVSNISYRPLLVAAYTGHC